jgi:CheY-like chemotaxis protein
MASENEQSTAPRGRVLVVDADRLTRLLLKDFLEDDGYEVTEAANGVEGIEALYSHFPDVVVSDAQLPEVDGASFLTRVASDAPHLPVVLISSDNAPRTLPSGADAFIRKPFDVYAIGRVIERFRNVVENHGHRESASSFRSAC